MTTIIRAAGAHDLLALVPALAGFVPERSIVCVAFRGARSAGVLRHDLPRRARDRSALVSAIVGTLCRMPGVDAVVPIAYTDATFHAARGVPERPLLSLLVRRAEQAGFAVRDALCRAADGWGSVLDPATPTAGHPLAMIDESTAARQVPIDDRVVVSASDAGRLPARDESVAAAVEAELSALADVDGCSARLERLAAEADPVALVEALLRRDPADVPALHLAWFLHLSAAPAIRDAMMLQFGFGRVVGAAAHDDAIASITRATEAGVTIDELVRRELADGDVDDVSDLLARLLLGRTGLRPDHRRVRRALDLVRWAAVHAPLGQRAAPLCVAAWLAWALGMGSAAGLLVEQAVAADPEHSMATLLAAFIGSGALPDWAFAEPEGDPGDR